MKYSRNAISRAVRGERDRRRTAAHFARSSIEREGADAKHVAGRRRAASRDRTQAGLKFAEHEPLAQIIVGARIQSGDRIFHCIARRQHQNRRGDAIRAHGARDGKSVFTGQVHV
jgi:hypothetical protein